MEGLDAFLEIEKYSHLLLGRLAIEFGFITYRELLEGLQIQHNNPRKRLGTVLVRKGHISLEQLKEVLNFQKRHLIQTKPSQWPEVPDTVLKGLYYFGGYSLGKVRAEDFHKAEELREVYLMEQNEKTLGKILVEDLHVASNEELQELHRKIKGTTSKAPCCDRLFVLFNYDGCEELMCPICWDTKLSTYKRPSRQTVELRMIKRETGQPVKKKGRKKKKKKSVGLTVEKAGGRPELEKAETRAEVEKKTSSGEKESSPRAGTELLEFYAAFKDMHTQSFTKMNRSKGAKASDAKKAPDAKEKPEASPQKQDKQVMGVTAQMELQKLYQEIEQDLSSSPHTSSTTSKWSLEDRHVEFANTQAKKTKILKTCALVASGIALVTILVLWYFARQSGPALPSPYIVKMDSKAQAESLRQNSQIALRPATEKDSEQLIDPLKQQKFKEVVSMIAVPHVSRVVLQDAQKRLDVLIACAKDDPCIGDYYNLKARVLFSQVWTDNYGQIATKKRRELLRQAIACGKKSEEFYDQEENDTYFSLTVMPWMQEAKKYRVRPWDKKFSKKIVYSDLDDARRDMYRSVGMMRKFLKREKSNGKEK